MWKRHWMPLPTLTRAAVGAQFISSVDFASYGTPVGKCGVPGSTPPFTLGKCHSKRSEQTLEDKCLANTVCMVTVAADIFGGDPCPAVATKRLAVQARGEQ